jgi:hypothetical protein
MEGPIAESGRRFEIPATAVVICGGPSNFVCSIAPRSERTRHVAGVSEELLLLRAESRRVVTLQLEKGAALPSQIAAITAQELEAKAILRLSELDISKHKTDTGMRDLCKGL